MNITFGMVGTIIGVIGSALAIYWGVRSNRRTITVDSEDDGREMGEILTKLGYIQVTVDEIKQKVNTQEERHLSTIQKIAALEAFKELISKRVEELEKQLNSIRNSWF